ncbi:5-hydroxytryptamine receptor 1F-like [Dendronephthya gigantea]|uniref:5-hydroxytryptamine receptor 1F-like n=1 Tax=Dendronephthya gigantea TaxID=151771 RepID=UPI00106B417E|nr:5-hydroxytryptamine receptor 1F-like [Dendronephthya gigantea]
MEAFSPNRTLNIKSDEEYSHPTIYKIVFIILSVLIALSNSTVLLLYHINPHIRSTKNLLLASLALSDLAAGTIVIPITLRCFGNSEWSICVASSTLFRFLAFSTILHILATIFEKYISILQPFWVVEKKHIRVTSGCIWAISSFVAIIPLVWLREGHSKDAEVVRKELVYFLVTFIGFFFIPFILIVFAQVRMFSAIHRSFTMLETSPVESYNLTFQGSPLRHDNNFNVEQSSYRTSSTQQNRKVLTAFALMLGTFTVCWLTWYVGVFLSYVDKEKFRKFSANLKEMLQIIVFLPSLVNPLLYTYYKKDFRQALQALLKSVLKALCH